HLVGRINLGQPFPFQLISGNESPGLIRVVIYFAGKFICYRQAAPITDVLKSIEITGAIRILNQMADERRTEIVAVPNPRITMNPIGIIIGDHDTGEEVGGGRVDAAILVCYEAQQIGINIEE